MASTFHPLQPIITTDPQTGREVRALVKTVDPDGLLTVGVDPDPSIENGAAGNQVQLFTVRAEDCRSD